MPIIWRKVPRPQSRIYDVSLQDLLRPWVRSCAVSAMIQDNACDVIVFTSKNVALKARSHDPFLMIRFLVLNTGSRSSDGPISRFRFCDENVGRSFVVCSHDPFLRTNKESSIWRQNDHTKFVGAFHLSRRVSDENRACSISIRFFQNHGFV